MQGDTKVSLVEASIVVAYKPNRHELAKFRVERKNDVRILSADIRKSTHSAAESLVISDTTINVTKASGIVTIPG